MSELKHILVTGGTGFLGAYIIRHLVLEGYQVRAIKRPGASHPFFIDDSILNKVEWVEGDVLELGSLEDAMEDVDAVIHSAAIVSFHPSDREQMYTTNVNGTANVVNLAIEKGIHRMVHVSSVAALGRSKGGELVDENKIWVESKSNTHYAISKRKAELEMWRGMAEGLNGVIVNPSTILGYGNWNSSSSAIFKNSFDEMPWYTEGVNGFVFVEDVAKAVVQLMRSDFTMERFIINGENWGFKKLLSTIANGFGKKPPYRKAAAWMGSIAWRLEKLKSFFTGKKPLLNKESAKVAQSDTRYDSGKITKALPGFSFTPLDIAIHKSCERYLKYHSQ